MTISSRTPEGQPNRCPICGAVVRIEPSQQFGDAPCPACGQLLRFVRREHDVYLVAGETGQAASDSLDLVELVMELEERQADR